MTKILFAIHSLVSGFLMQSLIENRFYWQAATVIFLWLVFLIYHLRAMSLSKTIVDQRNSARECYKLAMQMLREEERKNRTKFTPAGKQFANNIINPETNDHAKD